MLAQSPMDMRRLYIHHGVEQDLESCSVLLADFRTFSGMGDPVPGQCLVVLGDGEWAFSTCWAVEVFSASVSVLAPSVAL